MSADLIRVVLADDHAIVRIGLRAVLANATDIQLVGEGKSGKEAVELCQQLRPDVVVMDLDMPEMDGAGALKEMIALGLSARVLILSMFPEQDQLVRLLQSGASGYLVKSAAPDELVDAIRTVARGDTYVRGSTANLLARTLLRSDTTPSERARFESLTQRERDVLKQVALGFSAAEIGERLFISPKTVETYKQRIQEKMGLSHRSEYVQLSLRLGLMTIE